MKLDLYIDLEQRKLVAGPDNSAAPKLPPHVQGDTYDVSLHFLETTGGVGARTMREVRPAFDALKIGLGWIDKAPASGTWRVKCGADQTADLGFSISKQAFATALNALGTVTALGGVAVETVGAANIFQIRWNDPNVDSGDAVLEVVENRLAPKCFSRVSRYETDRGWLHIVKIFQAPIAFTDQFLFPTPPASTCAIARTGTGARNAVAALTVPDGAVGSLDLVWGGFATVILPVETLTSQAIETALNNLYTDGVQRFDVTNPRRGVFYIELMGPLGLAEQVAPGVNLHDQESLPSPVGVLSLDVPGAELALDGATSIKGLTLEGTMTLDGEAVTLFQQAITLYNDMIDTDMAIAADPDWLAEIRKPTATVDYDPAQAVIGMLGYQDFAGDAVAEAWTYTHNLGTLNIHITVRDNVSGLRVPDNLYTAEILNQNQVRITFPTPPAADQYVVIISSANADAHYSPHTHPIAEVEGLEAALEALSAAGNPLELWPVIPLDKLPTIPAAKISGPLPDALIPSNIPRLDGDGFVPLSVIPPEVPRILSDGSLAFRERTSDIWKTIIGPDGFLDTTIFGELARVPGFEDSVKKVLSGSGASAAAISFALPSYSELYPGRAVAPATPEALDAAALPRPGGLLPAIHDATITNLTIPLPTPGSPYTGNVYLNNTGADVSLPSGMGRKGTVLKAGEHAACDGRLWYRVAQQGSTTSWHPTDFERELLLLDVNEAMFPVSSIFTLLLDFEAQILRSETRAQWVVIVEIGTFASVANPAGTNISGITWGATPVITCPLHLTAIRTPHTFGVRFTRGASAITAETKLYRGAWTTSATAPAAAGFAVRARLARFDTEDSLSDPRGYVFLAMNPNKKSLATIV
ncbi:MAG: hypothetical protein WCS65_12580 [Verrucomicrobiae bacterium]